MTLPDIIIIHQPHLKCCANCRSVLEGYDGEYTCGFGAGRVGKHELPYSRCYLNATDVCEHFELAEGTVR
jgi:hypothetical protein